MAVKEDSLEEDYLDAEEDVGIDKEQVVVRGVDSALFDAGDEAPLDRYRSRTNCYECSHFGRSMTEVVAF